jgi:hypothetical protein
MPSWWKVFTNPDAAPASSEGASTIPKEVSGAKAKPCPAPISNIGSAIATRYPSLAPAWLSNAVPASVSNTPAARRTPPPTRLVSRGTAKATPKLTADIGRNPTPACSAVKPKTSCISWVVKKKNPIMAPRYRARAT